ncbi:MAG: sigma-70 family RNA polymerase sigma factor [Abditibacteriales bacterium]|nr:sigma-70 family RNA polymerase sigma factor [Abditibacteriales bacterium]MDW8368366.1 sigma-70 family RNA polymerase sigma factor [Abditibacteriales bacterium]
MIPPVPQKVLVMDDAEQALLARCRANDLLAFEEVVHRYKNKVHNYIARMVNDADDAEDLTQDVFVKAFISLGSFRGEASLQTWLYRIATNLCIDRARRRKRQRWDTMSLDEPVRDDEDDEIGRDVPDVEADPYRHLERKELRQQVRRALGRLSEKLRAVIVLYDVQGLSYEEIAQVLGCPLGTVKSRLFNARAELAKHLKPYLYGEGAEPHA